MTRSSPLVSVIVPCYNQAHYAYEAVSSAKSAYCGSLEVIIVDDGSTRPRSLEMLSEVRSTFDDERCSIRIVCQENRGLAGARNTGLALARGDFVQLLDCDDMLGVGKLDRQVQHFQIAGGLDVSVTDCLFSNESVDRFERHSDLLADSNYDLRDFALKWERGFSLPIHCALFHRQVFKNYAFEEKLRAKEDWQFWTRLAAGGARIAFLGGVGAIYRVHDTSMCRASTDLGLQWLTAALEIDKIARSVAPDFLDRAVEWYTRAYAGTHRAADKSFHPAPTTGPETAPAKNVVGKASMERGTRRNNRQGKPRFSVIIPVYEHYEFIEKCLLSVASQRVEDVEIIIVDDCSPDPRIKPLLQRYGAELGATVVFQTKNRGVSETQNTAIAAARGDYVVFLDCDDRLAGNALSKVSTFLDEHPDCDYLFTDRMDISDGDEFIRIARYGGYNDDRFTGEFRRDLLNGMVASHLKVVRRNAIERVGGFDSSLSGVQDWVLALSIAEFGRFSYLPEPLYCYRVHGDTVTSTDRRGQFQRTNIVRRRFASRYFRRNNLCMRFLSDDGTHLASRTLPPRDLSVRTLSEMWSAQPLIIDTTKGVTHREMWFLREFNSYIDQILWSAPEIHAALLGYVWSPEVLRHVQETR